MLFLNYMEMFKRFTIMNKPGSTGVTSSPELGLILSRPEVQEIAASFESRKVLRDGRHSIDIVPPIRNRSELEKLGGALVELARDLDPKASPADYKIQ